MKTHSEPTNIPQTEGHPEGFPKVTTIPGGWDLSETTQSQSYVTESIQNVIPLELDLDTRSAIQDSLA